MISFAVDLKGAGARLIFLAAGFGACAALLYVAVSTFLVNTLASERVAVSAEAVAAGAHYFPTSARLHARAAEIEMRGLSGDLARAESHASLAVNRSPYNFNYRFILASVQEAKRDLVAAEASLRAALALAPNNTDAHWRLANLLLRAGKLSPALDEFRVAASADPSLLGPALDLVWGVSNRRLDAVEFVTGDAAKARLTLAQFMLRQSRPTEAAQIFKRIDPQSQLAPRDISAFMNSLLAANEYRLARNLWADLFGPGDGAAEPSPLIWNGGFESDIPKDLTQFDWDLRPGPYARAGVEAGDGRNGSRALRITFAGRDTTVLENEVRQQVVLAPGARYRLEYFVRADDLVTPEGPRVVILNPASPEALAWSDPIVPGTWDWKRVSVDFTAPIPARGGDAVVYVSLRRKPRFSYDNPTRGSVCFDDFTLREQGREGGK
ncbi:MAG TPA: tetratricopeptide repeat protein [Blastocatellia bacterium]|nr:tetratricopeptide repeat protein [Blastocatellia bacterium]